MPADWPDGSVQGALADLTPLLEQAPRDQQRLVHLASRWIRIAMRAAVAIAACKVVTALAGSLLPGTWAATAVPTPVYTAVALSFGVIGAVLVIGGQWDERAQVLGWLDLLTAAFFCNRQIVTLADALSGLPGSTVRLLADTPVEALAPAALWLFVARFPDAPVGYWPQRVAHTMSVVSVLVGVWLVLVNVGLAALGSAAPDWWLGFARHDRNSYFSQAAFFTIPLVPLVLIPKSRDASGEDKRRVRSFCWALAIGFAPIIGVSIVASPWSPIAWWFTPARIRQVGVVVFMGLLSLPMTTAWALRSTRVLDVRFFARAAVRAAATRAGLVAFALVPALLFVRHLHRAGDLRLADVMADPATQALAFASALGAWLGFTATAVTRRVDQYFLRSRPEAAAAAARVAATARVARSRRELAEALQREVEELYQPESVSLLEAHDSGLQALVGPAPPLGHDTALLHILRDATAPLSLDPTAGDDLFHLLPASDQAWTMQARARHLFGLRAADDRLLGAFVFGRRRGDLAFTADDLAGIAAIVEAAGVVLEALARTDQTAADAALECSNCARIEPDSAAAACPACRGALRAAPVPPVVGEKYRLLARVGRGGMGTVYRAEDVWLGRAVAVKALHRVDGVLLRSLLAEARMTAALGVPGITQIYAVELWRNTPMVIMEYLPRGSLADPAVARSLGLQGFARSAAALCATLQQLHALGVAHRDVKPANIGLRADGSPCLLDLGLAGEARMMPWEQDHVGGTLPYVAPFILQGSSDYARGDVWSLCHSLLEVLDQVGASGDSRPDLLRAAFVNARQAIEHGDTIGSAGVLTGLRRQCESFGSAPPG